MRAVLTFVRAAVHNEARGVVQRLSVGALVRPSVGRLVGRRLNGAYIEVCGRSNVLAASERPRRCRRVGGALLGAELTVYRSTDVRECVEREHREGSLHPSCGAPSGPRTPPPLAAVIFAEHLVSFRCRRVSVDVCIIRRVRARYVRIRV